MFDPLRQITLEDWRNIAALAVAAVALVTFVKGVLEYTTQGAQKRAEYFVEMRKRFRETTGIEELCALLESGEQAARDNLRNVNWQQKRSFLGFFEELALMVKSGLIRRDVAHYMFGYYAIQCDGADEFWCNGIERDDEYWSLFREFASDMKYVSTLPLKVSHFRL